MQSEGFQTREEFLEAFQNINGRLPAGMPVFAVEFRVVNVPTTPGKAP